MSYGIAEAIRLLQEVDRPYCWSARKNSLTRSGPSRTSRMIFGDGAAAVVIAPAPKGRFRHRILSDLRQRSLVGGELHHLAESEFDNNITVYGPR